MGSLAVHCIYHSPTHFRLLTPPLQRLLSVVDLSGEPNVLSDLRTYMIYCSFPPLWMFYRTVHSVTTKGWRQMRWLINWHKPCWRSVLASSRPRVFHFAISSLPASHICLSSFLPIQPISPLISVCCALFVFILSVIPDAVQSLPHIPVRVTDCVVGSSPISHSHIVYVTCLLDFSWFPLPPLWKLVSDWHGGIKKCREDAEVHDWGFPCGLKIYWPLNPNQHICGYVFVSNTSA